MQSTDETTPLSTAQRRAEIRRRKLLMNSEDRMKRIVGFAKPESENNGASRRSTEPRFHLDLDTSPRLSLFAPEVSGSHHLGDSPDGGSPQPDSSEILGGVGGMSMEDAVVMGPTGVRQRPRGALSADEPGRSPHRGLQNNLSLLGDVMKLQDQLADENPSEVAASDPEELDSFRVFRLVGSVLLAIFVRVFVCEYLSIFAPFLTLELVYMGLFKYFPKTEKKMQSTLLTAALLLSGIPAEVISRSMDAYRRMADVFADLCMYFFTFTLCHEILLLVGSEALDAS